MIEVDESLILLQTMERGLHLITNPRFRDFVRSAIEKAYGGDFSDLKLAANYRWFPVDVEEFICGKKYLNARANVWPKVLGHLIEINSGNYVEAVLTGGIGVAKTTIAIYTTAFQTYLLSCLKSPHKIYQLDPASEIEFIFQSMNASLAKAVDYSRFRSLIQRSEYFQSSFKFDPSVLSELRFPNNIIVKPVGGSATGAIGQNVMGGVIDELNFMAVIEKSRQTVDRSVYDQALEMYDSLSRRRKSRFMRMGKMPGVLCLVSSKRYPGQFTDKKVADALREEASTGVSTVYVYDKRSWDVKPEGTYSGRMFKVYVGSESHKPAILSSWSEVDYDPETVVDIPEEYRSEFVRDIMGSLRDIAGVSTLARFPFIMEPEAVTRCMGTRKSIFNLDATDFITTKLKIFPKRFVVPTSPRFVHVDLAVTGDSAGFSCGTVTGFVKVPRGDHCETLPKVLIDGVLEIKPPKNGEILFHRIRSLIYALKKSGLNIQWITFDSYQSKDSMQLLSQQGFSTGLTSTDTTTVPYEVTKQALYDGRVDMPVHEKVRMELVSLEKDSKKSKIDHPPSGSKDCSDALASVIYGASYRKFFWAHYGVPMVGLSSAIASKADGGMQDGTKA